MHELYRLLPKVDDCLREVRFASLLEDNHRNDILGALRSVIEDLRSDISLGRADADYLNAEIARLPALVESRLKERQRMNLRKVVNATGVPLHTNLGRAPLAPEAIAAVVAVASGYSNLEYDLREGVRGSRHDHVRELLCRVTGAEDAMVVNNNAAAVLLMLSALADGSEVVVSRGQLVEVGGSFRIPDVMEQGGAFLREVGSTNKTHPADYLTAINERTVAFLKVHTSNYKMLGFCSEVSTPEMADLAHSRGLLALEDLGSGILVSGFGEPTVQEAVSGGMDLVTFSGDKLLGGPQAGLIVGKADLIARLRKHPLARAVRIDKMTLAALEATLHLYVQGGGPVQAVPVLRTMALSSQQLLEMASVLHSSIVGLGLCGAEIVPCTAPVGGGSLPGVEFPGFGVAIDSSVSANVLEARLRHAEHPVVGRIWEDRLLLDPRTLTPGDLDLLLASLKEVLSI
ncbi:MAG TPA: L-seryl-tRNA(Sec) selenium transferase [Bacillota bacterium]|nr:L-seryl-tRNA(Sec) selenium transferase [Bacillota bacterium]